MLGTLDFTSSEHWDISHQFFLEHSLAYNVYCYPILEHIPLIFSKTQSDTKLLENSSILNPPPLITVKWIYSFAADFVLL